VVDVGSVVVVAVGANVVVVVGGNVVVGVGGNVVVVVGVPPPPRVVVVVDVVVIVGMVIVVVVVVGGNVVVGVGGNVVVVGVETGSSGPTINPGAVSVPTIVEQLLRSYIGTATVVQPGWVSALISVILLEPVGSASESKFSTAAIRCSIVPA